MCAGRRVAESFRGQRDGRGGRIDDISHVALQPSSAHGKKMILACAYVQDDELRSPFESATDLGASMHGTSLSSRAQSAAPYEEKMQGAALFDPKTGLVREPNKTDSGLGLSHFQKVLKTIEVVPSSWVPTTPTPRP